MKREVIVGTLFAVALGVSAAAQSTASQYPSGQDKDKDKDTVTVTGCLVPSSASAVGTSGSTATTTATPSAAGFMLINASKDGAPSATTTAGTSGTTAAPAAASGKSFILVGGDPSDLQKWTNSKVEIKGTIEAAGAMPPATTATPDNPEKAAAQRLRVTSVKQVAGSCSDQ
jgi:hypothetical protein